MSDDTNDYEVGYAKPPKHSQFKPGQSGNPKGRPKRVRNFKTDLQEELQARITVSEGGKPLTISRQQAVIKRTMEKALQGDLRAVQMLAQWVGTYLVDDPEALTAEPLTAEDLALLARYGLDRDPDSNKPETITGGQEDD